MHDFSVPNHQPGDCAKCGGNGEYRWGAPRPGDGLPRFTGRCFACRGTGRQDAGDIKRNRAYNRHKIAALS